MPRISFMSFAVGLFFASVAAGFVLGRVVGDWFILAVFGLVALQLLALAVRPMVIPLHHTTEQTILRFTIYLLLLDFLLFVAIVALREVEPHMRIGMIAAVVITVMLTGALALRHVHINRFSQVRL